MMQDRISKESALLREGEKFTELKCNADAVQIALYGQQVVYRICERPVEGNQPEGK